MKILQLSYEYPPLGGGAGVCCRFESEGLAAMGHEVTVLSTWFEGEEEFTQDGNLKVYKVKAKRKVKHKSDPIEMLSYAKHAKKFLLEKFSKGDFDVAIAHYAIPSGIVAKKMKKEWGLPYFVVSHGHDIPFFLPKQMLKFHLVTYFWLRGIFRNADKTVVLTQPLKGTAEKFLGKHKAGDIVVIPNGCHTAQFKPDYSKKKKKFTLLFVGRQVGQKDPMSFLAALKILKDKALFDFEVEILGDGPMRAKMENYVNAQKLNDCVHFRGWVDKETMMNAYQSSHVQVISSTYEAMSIAALESLSSGLYLLSTPVSGNTDIIEAGVNGDFLEMENPENIAMKIEEFHREKYLSNYTVDQSYVDRFRDEYDWGTINKKYHDLAVSTIKTS